MNPVVMCNVLSPCNDDQLFVFGVVALLAVAVVAVVAGGEFMFGVWQNRKKKGEEMTGGFSK